MPEFSIFAIAIDILTSWIRMLIALGLSIVFSLAVGITAARNRRAEAIIIPVLDIFQSIPILGFFPIVIFGIITVIPSPEIGVNLAVIILIFTSMSWNIAFGVYEAVKSIPQDYIDLSNISDTGAWGRIKSLYIPASMSRIAYNTQTSWAVGLFYIISSEILTFGTRYQVTSGIGVALVGFGDSGDWTGYTYAIIALVITVIVWQVIFLREFALWAERYKFVEDPSSTRKDALMRFYSWANQKSISKLFLLTQGRGVTRFSSALYRFRRGIKYAAAILFLIFAAFEISALMNVAPSALSKMPNLNTIFSEETGVAIALGYSFIRVWYVYFICVAIGLPLGIAIAINSKLYNTISPTIEVVASIPGPALLPAFVLLFNHNGEAVAALIIFLGMIWYIIFNVMAGIRTLPAELFELKREFRISRIQTWRNIYLPASFTAFVTGSITAIGAAWNALIVAEYFNPSGTAVETQVGIGIGKSIALASLEPPNLLVLTLAVVSMTALIVVFNLTVWRRVYHYTTKRYTYNR